MNESPAARYRILETIGRGGMGEVCLGHDLMLDRPVALKFLASPGQRDASDRLLAEARAAASLDHPFICSIYEVCTLDGRPCIAMEYVRGETLDRRLRRSPLPLAEALRVAEEIAEALEAAHKRRVVHGDLKPSNVILTEDRHVKVMDFGLATRLPAGDGGEVAAAAGLASGTIAVRGTPAYMAPEQIRGTTADRRSDIFSFGILLYELLAGVNPFARAGVDATLAAILGDPAVDLHHRAPSIPPLVGTLVARALAKDPAARHQTFGEVRTELRRAAISLAAPGQASPSVVADRGAADGTPRILGRDAERAQLLESIGEAISGRGVVVVLTGEAGIGKTRLAEEALEAARRRGCQALVGRCYEHDGTPPLVPYIEVLEEAARLIPASAFRQAVGAGAPELARLLPELHRLFPDMGEPLELPPHLRQRFLFTNVREFLTRCGRLAPLVILVDDFQWADEPTVRLTQHLAQHAATLPLVLIVACRDPEPAVEHGRGALRHLFDLVRRPRRAPSAPEAARDALDDLVRQGRARALALRPLGETEVRGMLAALARTEPPERIARQFLAQTGGNPFFVSELFRHLEEEGRLLDARGRWARSPALDEADVPETVRAVVERRLARVSRGAREVLGAAAVIGRHFDADLLEGVAAVRADALLAVLDEAEQARLLHGPSGRQDMKWRFTHPLIWQALRHALPPTRRQRLHLRVADALEAAAGRQSHVSEIAHHLYSAGPLAAAARTTRALLTAGEAAGAVYATDEAVLHYRRALAVLQEAPGEERTRLEVEERLADLLALLGETGEALARYDTLAEAYEARRLAVDRARISRKLGGLHWQAGDRARAMACYEGALGAFDGSGADVEAAHLYHELGLAAFRSGDNERAIAWAERAVRSAEAVLADGASPSAALRRTATAALAHATNTIGVALARSGQLEPARDRIERSVATARALGLIDVACRGYANLGVLYSTVEPQRAIDVSLTGLEMASRIGAASLQSYIYANLAAAYCALTDRCDSEGLQAARAAAALDRELNQLDHLAVPLIVMAQIHQCRGEIDEAQRNYDEALSLARQTGEPQLLLPCYDGLATICLDRGDRTRAEQYMQQSRELCDRTGLDPDAVLLLPFLS